MIPYGRQSIDAGDVAEVAAALDRDFITTGPTIGQFEDDLSAVAGGHPVVVVNSGTAAIHAAYAALGVGPGNSILTSPITFVSTASSALHLGAEVIFADVSDDTLTLDPASAAAAVRPSTCAVVAVDYAGQPADYDGLRQVAATVDARMVADAAHSLGSKLDGRPVGDLADLTTFSFHAVKTITTAEGGAVVVREPRFLDAVRRFRNHGLVRDPVELRSPAEGPWHQEVHQLGLNYRMPDVLAALGSSQLRRLPAFAARRAQLARRYDTLLAGMDGLQIPKRRAGAETVWHLYAVRILGGRRREVFERLRRAGIGVQVHYLPVYWHPLFADRGYQRGMCPVAEAAYQELLSIPLFPDLLIEDQDRVVAELRRALGEGDA